MMRKMSRHMLKVCLRACLTGALALAAAGRFDEANELVDKIREFIAQEGGQMSARYAAAVLPSSEAAIAHRKGDYQQVIDCMLAVRRSLWQMGGSHAQRDIFERLGIEAAFRCGMAKEAETLLQQRDRERGHQDQYSLSRWSLLEQNGPGSLASLGAA